MITLIFFFVLNFGISWFNAWSCGRAWDEAKSHGPFSYLVVWSGAIMSASGFTWCFLVIATLFGAYIPLPLTEDAEGATQWMTVLTPDQAIAMFSLGYLIIVFPILGSGMLITVHSWVQAYHTRRLIDAGVAGYNTFAQIYNIAQATQHVPDAFTRVMETLFGGSSSSDSENKGGVALLIIGAVIVCVLAGCMLTYNILSRARTQRIWEMAQKHDIDLYSRHAA